MKNRVVKELPLSELLERCPELKSHIPPSIDVSDEKYIARVSSSGALEIGYIEDDWTLKKSEFPLS